MVPITGTLIAVATMLIRIDNEKLASTNHQKSGRLSRPEKFA